jgi:succinate dehydrogenase / fumarate reductase cytochrome b subunit
MAAAIPLYRTTIGRKAIMALTGFIGYGFVIAHMVGNLHIFEGEQKFNEYAEFLRVVGEPVLPYSGVLWILRIVLIVSVVLHVWAAISLSRTDWAARPSRYGKSKALSGNFATMTLRWGGLAIFLFVVYHLTHLTFGWTHPDRAAWAGHEAAYQNVIAAFSNPIAVAIYAFAMFALSMHLFHGVWSMFQTLGLNNRRSDKIWRGLAILSAVALFVGFMTVPAAVLLGAVG